MCSSDLNLGLRDVASLAGLIIHAHREGRDVGDNLVLAQYRQERAADHHRIRMATQLLARGFVSRLPLVGIARRAVLMGLELSPSLRRRFSIVATGLLPPLPELVGGGCGER